MHKLSIHSFFTIIITSQAWCYISLNCIQIDP